jgi:hypothetical protein
MIITRGIHRLKCDLGHISKNVIGCPRVPIDLKHQIAAVVESIQQESELQIHGLGQVRLHI